MDSRKCTQCSQEKDASHFSWRNDGSHKRLTSRCKECRRLNYKENPQHNRDRSREYYDTNKLVILEGLKQRRRMNPVLSLLHAAKARSKRLGVPFDLQESDVVVPEICPVLGIPLIVNDGKCGPNSPTLDRVIGALGYVRGNVVVVSFKANTIKNDATLDELRSVLAFYDRLVLRAA